MKDGKILAHAPKSDIDGIVCETEGDQGLKFGKLEEPKQMVQNQLQGALQIASLTKYHPLLSIVQ